MARADSHYPGTAEEAEIRTAPARAVTRLKRPNQKQYNKELADICASIGKLLEEQKGLDGKERAEADECRRIRQEKSAEFVKKRDLEATLKAANQEVVNKSDCLAKLQINLHYKNEARLDEAIRRLEAQLNSCSWKQSGEKKVLDEIDSLKRSKSTLMQYNQLKEELDVLKQQVKLTRQAREEVFQSLSALKAKEDHHTRERADSRARGASVRTELDAFFEAKRKLKDDYAQQKEAYSAQRAEAQRHDQDKARLAAEQRKKTQPHTEVVKKYHDKEHQLCSMLLQYLHRLAGSYLGAADDAQENAPTTKEPCHEVEGMRRLRDKDTTASGCSGGAADVEGLGAAAATSKKRGKKKRRHRLDKPLCHTPEAVSWFIELHLAAPATAADIGRVMEQLTVLKAQHEPAASGGMGSERRAVAPDDRPELDLQSPANQPAFDQEALVEGSSADVTAGHFDRAQATGQGVGGCVDMSTGGNSEECTQLVTCTSGAAAMAASPDCCCCHRSSAGCSAASTDAAAASVPAEASTCSTCCCATDSTPESEPAAAPHGAVEAFPDWNASSTSALLADTADIVTALCGYEGKSFIQQSLSLAASGGRDDGMSNVTMA